MTENQMDGGSAEGTVTNANGNASGNQSVQQPSFDAAKLQSSIDALIGKVGELEARTNGLQSVKDKTTTEVSGLKAKIAEYEQLKEKLGPDGALDQMELKQTLAEIKQQLSSQVSPQATGSSVSGAVDAAKTFAEVGLDPTDPRVAVALNTKYSTVEQAELAAYRLQKTLASSPSPTPAQSASLQGTPAQPSNVSELTQEYKHKMLAARGNEKLLTSIRDEYFKKGVPVYNVSF